MKISAAGFENYIANEVVLNVAQKRSLNAQLKTGSVAESVTVTDNPVAIDTTSSSQSGTISGTQIRELALVDRNFQQLVLLQPGVVNIGLGDEPVLD